MRVGARARWHGEGGFADGLLGDLYSCFFGCSGGEERDGDEGRHGGFGGEVSGDEVVWGEEVGC